MESYKPQEEIRTGTKNYSIIKWIWGSEPIGTSTTFVINMTIWESLFFLFIVRLDLFLSGKWEIVVNGLDRKEDCLVVDWSGNGRVTIENSIRPYLGMRRIRRCLEKNLGSERNWYAERVLGFVSRWDRSGNGRVFSPLFSFFLGGNIRVKHWLEFRDSRRLGMTGRGRVKGLI